MKRVRDVRLVVGAVVLVAAIGYYAYWSTFVQPLSVNEITAGSGGKDCSIYAVEECPYVSGCKVSGSRCTSSPIQKSTPSIKPKTTASSKPIPSASGPKRTSSPKATPSNSPIPSASGGRCSGKSLDSCLRIPGCGILNKCGGGFWCSGKLDRCLSIPGCRIQSKCVDGW